MNNKKYKHPLFDKVLGEYMWCLHCECVCLTEQWVQNKWNCPGNDCDGSLLDAQEWSWVVKNKTEYPEIPELNKHYPLY